MPSGAQSGEAGARAPASKSTLRRGGRVREVSMARVAAWRGARARGGTGGRRLPRAPMPGGRVADAARRCSAGGGRTVQSAMRAPAGWSSSTDRSACSRGDSEAVVTMVPSPAARSVVVGGNCPCGGRACSERGMNKSGCEERPNRLYENHFEAPPPSFFYPASWEIHRPRHPPWGGPLDSVRSPSPKGPPLGGTLAAVRNPSPKGPPLGGVCWPVWQVHHPRDPP